MSLPRVELPREKVSVGGEEIEVRGLTRGEAIRVRNNSADMDRMEIIILACGTDLPEDEIAAWRDSTPAGVVEPIVDVIVRLSGLGEGAQKSSREAVPEG